MGDWKVLRKESEPGSPDVPIETKHVAALAGVAPKTLYDWIKRGLPTAGKGALLISQAWPWSLAYKGRQAEERLSEIRAQERASRLETQKMERESLALKVQRQRNEVISRVEHERILRDFAVAVNHVMESLASDLSRIEGKPVERQEQAEKILNSWRSKIAEGKL